MSNEGSTPRSKNIGLANVSNSSNVMSSKNNSEIIFARNINDMFPTGLEKKKTIFVENVFFIFLFYYYICYMNDFIY